MVIAPVRLHCNLPLFQKCGFNANFKGSLTNFSTKDGALYGENYVRLLFREQKDRFIVPVGKICFWTCFFWLEFKFTIMCSFTSVTSIHVLMVLYWYIFPSDKLQSVTLRRWLSLSGFGKTFLHLVSLKFKINVSSQYVHNFLLVFHRFTLLLC